MSRNKLHHDEEGASTIEMAIALPVLFLFIYGLFQMGLLFEANAGMQHALGEASRYASIYPTPSDANLQARITSKLFGTSNGTFSTPTISTDTTAKTKVIRLIYSQPLNFLIVPGPTVTLTRSKTVYYAT